MDDCWPRFIYYGIDDIEWLQGLLIKFKGELNETFPDLLNVTFSKLRNTP